MNSKIKSLIKNSVAAIALFVCSAAHADTVATITTTDSVIEFDYLDQALECAADGETVVLCRDANVEDDYLDPEFYEIELAGDKRITLDLNGHQIDKLCFIPSEEEEFVHATITVRNGFIDQYEDCDFAIYADFGMMLVLDDVTVYGTVYTEDGCELYAGSFYQDSYGYEPFDGPVAIEGTVTFGFDPHLWLAIGDDFNVAIAYRCWIVTPLEDMMLGGGFGFGLGAGFGSGFGSSYEEEEEEEIVEEEENCYYSPELTDEEIYAEIRDSIAECLPSFGDAEPLVFGAWLDNVANLPEDLEFDEFVATPHVALAFAFNKPYDFFAKGTVGVTMDGFTPNRPEEGWATVVFHVTVDGEEIAVDQVNNWILAKMGTTPSEVDTAEPVLAENVYANEDGRVVLELAPPAGSCGFFKVVVRDDEYAIPM